MLSVFSDLSDCVAADSVKHKTPDIMELLYVWIEDYKNIKKQGFNFSPKHWFDFKPEEDKEGKIIGGTLHHKERNTNYPKKFFGENISNVTAIVGKNGSGKTNILEFVMEIIFNQRKPEETNFIISFFDENKKMFCFNNCDFQIEHYFNTEHKDIIDDGPNIYWRYYSANLQERSSQNALCKIESPPTKYTYRTLNISTFGQLGDIEIKKEHKESVHFKDFLSTYQYKNTHRQVLFLKEHSEKLNLIKQHIRIPDNLELLYPQFNNNLEKIVRSYFDKSRTITPREEFAERLKLKILVDLSVHPPFSFKMTELKSISNDLIETILNKYEDQSAHLKKGIELLKIAKNAINKSENLVDYLYSKRILNVSKPIVIGTTKSYKSFSLKIENFNAIEFYERILETLGYEYEHLIEVKWEGLSAGEEVLLNQMGMLNQTYNEIIDNTYIMLAIDEGEITLHPEWQREYLNLIRKTIELISKSNQKTHLILSTHSPFLVSDLPKDNIIFLNKNKDRECEVKQPEDMTHTFGANIHSLYRNSFFLENGLMGEFAKGKIDQVIRNLNNEQLNEKEKMSPEDIQFVIQQIGEPLIKNKLQQMYDQHFHFDLEDRIKQLEKEVADLKKRRK